jgi:hypothetical protein
MGEELGIVERVGARYTFEETKAHGMEKAMQTFDIDRLRMLVIEKLGIS